MERRTWKWLVCLVGLALVVGHPTPWDWAGPGALAHASGPAANVIYVGADPDDPTKGDVGALNRAVYGAGNEGAVIDLAPLTFRLDPNDPDAENGGRLALQRNQVLRGHPGGSTEIECQAVEYPADTSLTNPHGAIEVVGRGAVEQLAVVDSSYVQPPLGSPTNEGRVGILLRNGGRASDTDVSNFPIGLVAYIDEDQTLAFFELDRNYCHANGRGGKIYSVATGSLAFLVASHNRFEDNAGTALLVQAGGEGGIDNCWYMLMGHNTYLRSGTGAYVIAGDGAVGAHANELYVTSLGEQARDNVGPVSFGDYAVATAFRFPGGEAHDDNLLRLTMIGGDVGSLNLDAGTSLDVQVAVPPFPPLPAVRPAGSNNDLIATVRWSTADRVLLSDGFDRLVRVSLPDISFENVDRPAAAGNLTVTGSVNRFLRNNAIGELAPRFPEDDLRSFFRRR